MDFLNPKTLQEALEMLMRTRYPILAGGTDLVVQLNSGLINPKGLINIWNLNELKEIKEFTKTPKHPNTQTPEHPSKGYIEIGALTTHTELINNELIRKYVPALVEACKTIGARQTQNRGTIGGNVMNASPAGDTLPVLLVYDTEVLIAGLDGERTVSFNKFYKGYRKTVLKKDELVIGFLIPKTKSNEKSSFVKVGTRKAQAISKVVGCFRMKLKNVNIHSISIAFGSVAPIPIRLSKTEKLLKGKSLTEEIVDKVSDVAVSEIQPIDDIRSTAVYRQYVVKMLLKRFLNSCL